jgi:hypothetical protein
MVWDVEETLNLGAVEYVVSTRSAPAIVIDRHQLVYRRAG